MTIEKIYKAYSESAQYRQDQALERAMEEMLDGLRTAGVDTMQAEEQINTILNMQEEAAFRAGFCEAFDLVLDTAHCASRGGL